MRARTPETVHAAGLAPYSLKDAPALIERLLPVQKLSAEVYAERVAGTGQTLTALGNFWKGRKPLILAKACVLGCLLPVSGETPEALERDLEIFEMLMGMDDVSFVERLNYRPSIDKVLGDLYLRDIYEYVEVTPAGALPPFAPVQLSDYGEVKRKRYGLGRVVIQPHGSTDKKDEITVKWREDLSGVALRRLWAQTLARKPYRERVTEARRPEEVPERVHEHIWEEVNAHLGTDARSLPELVEQLGFARWGHRPRVADVFCGSGQIPFEAARLGCDVYASDLNPIAAMLTWGAFHIVGGSAEVREQLAREQATLVQTVRAEIDALGVEMDGEGWRARAFVYCVEARCPETGWMTPLMPSRVLSEDYGVIAEMVPDPVRKRYDVLLRTGATVEEMKVAERGTVRSDGRGQEPYMVHTVDGIEYRTKISTLRGDYRREDGSTGNRLRHWQVHDFKPRPDDIFQERLYGVLWARPRLNSVRDEVEFRSVTEADLERERVVEEYVAEHLAEWQAQGWVPDMRIEPGYNTTQPIRERGWTHWHHLFNARQLLLGAMVQEHSGASQRFRLSTLLDYNSRLSGWLGRASRGYGNTAHAFYNQALNTLYNYGTRSTGGASGLLGGDYRSFPIDNTQELVVGCHPADELAVANDIYITDPPYGDAVKYEEITEFFIAWLRKNPPPEFANWVWDSRRAFAIQGQGDAFRRDMAAAYTRMATLMPDDGIQVLMFTHQSGSIWADMANIVWAAGLQVTAAWYVVTETESALREGSYVKGTVLLVVRKRKGSLKTTRADLGFELEEEVREQVQSLTGLNQQARGLYRDENLFEDADVQMAGYAAALRVLTRYSAINGREMASEALRPRQPGQTTFVDELIEFAVDTANQSLVPHGIGEAHWKSLKPAERFYLKMLELEARGLHTIDNYQNFAKAFKVRDFRALMQSDRANAARLKSAAEFGKTELGESSELYNTPVRTLLFAMWEVGKETEIETVLLRMEQNLSGFYQEATRALLAELAAYLSRKMEYLRPAEARAAQIVREAILAQKV